jgi:hypothetical protein
MSAAEGSERWQLGGAFFSTGFQAGQVEEAPHRSARRGERQVTVGLPGLR